MYVQICEYHVKHFENWSVKIVIKFNSLFYLRLWSYFY